MIRITANFISVKNGFNHFLDELVKPVIFIAGRKFSHFHFWVNTGVVVGILVIMSLTFNSGILPSVMMELVLLVASLSLFLFKSTKIFGKSYKILNWVRGSVYHFQIVALFFSVVFLRLRHEPVFPYLDILVIGILVSQVFGRIGCLMAGCCHGRPHTWGVCYGQKYAVTRYVYFLQKVRLFPVQLVECCWLFLLTILAIAVITNNPVPGENVSMYIIGYGTGRFFFEFMRGDLERVYVFGFSEPQLTAILLAVIICCLEYIGILSFHWWQFFATSLMVTVMVILYYRSKYYQPAMHQILQPDHILELFQTVDWLINQCLPFFKEGKEETKKTLTGLTSLGIQIGLSCFGKQINGSFLYEISHSEVPLRRHSAKAIAKLIMHLKHSQAKYKITETIPGVFQLLVYVNTEIPNKVIVPI